MADTRPVTIDLDAGTLRFIEREVQAGRVADTGAFLRAAVDRAVTDCMFEEVDEDSPEYEVFIQECLETDRLIDAGQEPTFTVDEFRRRLEEHRTARDAKAEVLAAE